MRPSSGTTSSWMLKPLPSLCGQAAADSRPEAFLVLRRREPGRRRGSVPWTVWKSGWWSQSCSFSLSLFYGSHHRGLMARNQSRRTAVAQRTSQAKGRGLPKGNGLGSLPGTAAALACPSDWPCGSNPAGRQTRGSRRMAGNLATRQTEKPRGNRKQTAWHKNPDHRRRPGGSRHQGLLSAQCVRRIT